MTRLATALLIFTLGCVSLSSCHISPPSGSPPESFNFNQTVKVLMDAELPDIPLVAASGTTDKPDPNTPAPRLSRSSLMPQAGLWSIQTTVISAATMSYNIAQAENLRQFDTIAIYTRIASPAGATTRLRGRVYIMDANHVRFFGDWYPLFGQWDAIPLDIASAEQAGVNVESVTAIGLDLSASDETPVDVFTDSWQATSNYRPYLGQRLGVSKSFYVQGNGGRLSVGVVDRFEMTFLKRSTDGQGARPWIEVRRGSKSALVLGQPGTGLMLLDQDQRDALQGTLHGDGTRDATATQPNVDAISPWPVAGSTYEWTVAWTSPIAALVEVKQVSGPYDRLGRPALTALWRFMIYQTGEVFTSVSWQPVAKETDPVSVALAVDRSVMAVDPEEAKVFLHDLYPTGSDQKVMPHEMQLGAPVAMLAKTAAAKDSYWESAIGHTHLFGVDLPRGAASPMTCILLINSPTQLDQVSAFSSYMQPAGATMKTGTLDTTFPGDFDNDSLVEPYGFQTIRMSDGRAWFTLEPGNRPIFYPTLLLTIPAAERDHIDLTKFNLLINVDGQQVAKPPRWPDGSFLVQLPFIVSKPVRVEATLTPK